MFQWANKQLEKLSETLAPPPSTPAHRYLAAVASHQEDVALGILNDPHEPLDPYSSLNQKGMNALHAAASHGIVNIIRQLVGRGARIDIADYNGWTALHHAAASRTMSAQSAMATVKVLVEELGASVVMKDATAHTPYDVGTSQAVRGYLLPKQLQQETQECLDNGGAGLMPGIDMGGMKINYNNVAPPPVIGTPGGVPPQPSTMNGDPSAALMQPPPVRGINSTFSPNPHGGKSYNAATSFSSPDTVTPITATAPNSDVIIAGSRSIVPPQNNNVGDVQPHQENQLTSFPQQPPAPTQNNSAQTSLPEVIHTKPAEQPPSSNNSTSGSSSGYARRGGNSNSAFVLNESSFAGRKLYKPDGFHTSSNDKELQAKYGHVENSFETSRKLAVPPPPSSGTKNTGSPAPHSGGANPYSAMGAGNAQTMGYIGGTGRARYPAYCAVSDSVSAPPSLGGTSFSSQIAAPPAPTYSTFNPGAVQHNSVAASVAQTQQWSGEQQQHHSSAYSNQYATPTAQTQHWSGEHQAENCAQTNVPVPTQNVAPSYVVQSHQAPTYNQQLIAGYASQAQQPSQQEVTTTTATDGAAQTAVTTAIDAASMFATPHAEDKKATFSSSGETAVTSSSEDVFSSPAPTDNGTNGPEQQQAINKGVEPSNQAVLAPVKNESPPDDSPAASSFFSAPSSTTTSENTVPAKRFGGLPPPPVFGNSSAAAKPLPTPSNGGGLSSLPPPPMMKSFSNQTSNAAAPVDEIPAEQFADVSLS